jgi:hypothetical protein
MIMKTLTIVPMPAPDKAPNLDMHGAGKWVARIIPKRGEEFVVCNPMDEIIEAHASGYPFVAHRVTGMQMPKRVIIEPGTIARIEEL